MRRAKESNSLKIKVMSASNRRKRLPTNVEDVVPCIQRVGSLDEPECENQTRGDKQGCSRADDIAASSVGRSPPSRTRPRPKNSPILCASRRVHQHRLQAEFVLLGGVGEGEEGECIGQARGFVGKSALERVASSEHRPRGRARRLGRTRARDRGGGPPLRGSWLFLGRIR